MPILTVRGDPVSGVANSRKFGVMKELDFTDTGGAARVR